jgi:hypothetical protein
MTARLVPALLALTLWAGIAHAAESQHCVRAEVILWGDGRHDDTAALNAWFAGRNATWAESGKPVGPVISGHDFRLSAAVYVPGGTGRELENFRMLWPERGETVSGGTIRAGSDPNAPPAASGIEIVGGDSGEGKPFEVPEAPPPDPGASCAIS